MNYAEMNLVQLREEAMNRVNAGKDGWHNESTWIRWATQKQLRNYLTLDRAPSPGETPSPAPIQNQDGQPDQQLMAPPPAPMPTPGMPGLDALGALLAPAIQPFLQQQKVDLSALQKKVDDQIATIDQRVQDRINELRPVERIIYMNRIDGEKLHEVEGQHKQYSEATEVLLCRRKRKQNLLLSGPAGTGKSMFARKFAEAMKLPFYLQSCGAGTQEFHFWGHTTANGDYMETPTYQAFKSPEGAVLCIDEIDASSPDVGLVLNAITNGDEACFPHPIGCLPRPERLYVIATANTLNGADARYGARFEMDGALRNRFAVIFWQHDLDFEAVLYARFAEWRKYVQACREAIDKLRIPYVVSTRNIEMGEDMLAGGNMGKRRIEEIALWGDGCLPVEQANKVRDAVKKSTGLVWG